MMSLGVYGLFNCAFTASLLHLSRNNPRFFKLVRVCAVLYVGVFFSAFVLPYTQAVLMAAIRPARALQSLPPMPPQATW